MHEMIGNEDVFRFQEGYALCLAVTADILNDANDFPVPILVPPERRLPLESSWRV